MFGLALLAAAVAPGSVRDTIIDSPNRWTWRGVVPHGASVEIRASPAIFRRHLPGTVG